MSDGVKTFLVTSFATIALSILSASLINSRFAVLIVVATILVAFGLSFVPAKTRVNKEGVRERNPRQVYARAVQFFITVFIVGMVVGGLSLLPFIPAAHLDFGLGNFIDALTFGSLRLNTSFYSFELIAAGAVTIMAAVGLLLGRSLPRALSFEVAGIGGMSFSVSLLRPEQEWIFSTFIGWGVAGVLVICILALLPTAVRLLVEYWSPSKRSSSNAIPATDKTQSDPGKSASVTSESDATNLQKDEVST
jgi:uncharacterized membrane protein